MTQTKNERIRTNKNETSELYQKTIKSNIQYNGNKNRLKLQVNNTQNNNNIYNNYENIDSYNQLHLKKKEKTSKEIIEETIEETSYETPSETSDEITELPTLYHLKPHNNKINNKIKNKNMKHPKKIELSKMKKDELIKIIKKMKKNDIIALLKSHFSQVGGNEGETSNEIDRNFIKYNESIQNKKNINMNNTMNNNNIYNNI